MEISIHLPVIRSILVNRVKFYPDLSLIISIDLPVLRSILIKRVKLLFRSVFANFHRFTRVLKSNVINRVQFSPDLSLEISIEFTNVKVK